jgi:AcrR family transcriptional regulator
MERPDRKAPRGRPKTFDRSHVVAVAMNAYWEDGQSEVSLNAVCKRAKVSKPSLYQEFGSEDGLKLAVLCDYHKMTLAPLYQMLAQDQPFDGALANLTEYILRDHQEHGMPKGCLFIDMCQCRDHLGELTGAKSSISPRLAALYIDAQIANIMNMQRQDVAQKDIASVFRLALSVFE